MQFDLIILRAIEKKGGNHLLMKLCHFRVINSITGHLVPRPSKPKHLLALRISLDWVSSLLIWVLLSPARNYKSSLKHLVNITCMAPCELENSTRSLICSVYKLILGLRNFSYPPKSNWLALLVISKWSNKTINNSLCLSLLLDSNLRRYLF